MKLSYLIDLAGLLWRGPVNPQGNLHWERFDGYRDGAEVWTLALPRPPLSASRIPAAEAQRLIEATRK